MFEIKYYIGSPEGRDARPHITCQLWGIAGISDRASAADTMPHSRPACSCMISPRLMSEVLMNELTMVGRHLRTSGLLDDFNAALTARQQTHS